MPADEKHFGIALRELIGMCTDAGMSRFEFIGALKTELTASRVESMPSKFDDAYNSEHGLPPMTEATMRQVLKRCDLDQPCHANVLLEIANSDAADIRRAQDDVDEGIFREAEAIAAQR